MKISTILDHIDSGHMALPEFQRGYVWNRDQVRGLFESLYRRHPVGSLLTWATESSTAETRGGGQLPAGVVKLLLDGQQRMTSLYGVIRGAPPKFFEGNAQAFMGLHFHLADEKFEFFQPIKMRDDPRWIDVTKLFKAGNAGLGTYITDLSKKPEYAPQVGDFVGRLSAILAIRDIEFHIAEISGKDKTIDVVVDIFNRVNSGGTKLSKGDLALAKICADWPDARTEMRKSLKSWKEQGFDFNLDWLLRNVNTVTKGEAKFLHLHDAEPAEVQDGLRRSVKAINASLNMIGGRLGLDHDRVLFGRFAVPVMSHYLDRVGGTLPARERDRLLFWFVQCGMWGRYSSSVESFIDQDLKAIEKIDGGLDRLIHQLALAQGGLKVLPGHFGGWSLGARFYPVLYLLTRVGGAMDWGLGLPLKANMLGKGSKLEVHHIFPKSILYKAPHGYQRPEVNAVANFCFLTKDSNLDILADHPEVYFPQVEAAHPGALASQWIPDDPQLWRIDRYRDFLVARQELLAKAANSFLADLLHGDTALLDHARAAPIVAASDAEAVEPGGDDRARARLNAWVKKKGLAIGIELFELTDPETNEPVAVLDLAWPDGLQEGLGEKVAFVADGDKTVMAAASRLGFRCFGSEVGFKRFVDREVLVGEELDAAQ